MKKTLMIFAMLILSIGAFANDAQKEDGVTRCYVENTNAIMQVRNSKVEARSNFSKYYVTVEIYLSEKLSSSVSGVVYIKNSNGTTANQSFTIEAGHTQALVGFDVPEGGTYTVTYLSGYCTR